MNNIEVSPEVITCEWSDGALKTLSRLDGCLRAFILNEVYRQVPYGHKAMIVCGLSEQSDEIVRTFKTYRPMYRVLFHFRKWTILLIDEINERAGAYHDER